MKTAYLEGNHCKSHHTQVDHGQRIFAPQQSGVEESYTRNHDPNERGRCQNPCDITRVVHEGSQRRVGRIWVHPHERTSCCKISSAAIDRECVWVKGAHRRRMWRWPWLLLLRGWGKMITLISERHYKYTYMCGFRIYTYQIKVLAVGLFTAYGWWPETMHTQRQNRADWPCSPWKSIYTNLWLEADKGCQPENVKELTSILLTVCCGGCLCHAFGDMLWETCNVTA